MPIQSPAKDLRKTSAGALFGQGREMGSAQPTERPRKALQRSVRCCWSYFAVFQSIWAKNERSTRYTDAPLVRETDTCTQPEGARGSVRAMPEHSTCRYGFVVTDEHRTNCNTRSPRSPRSNRGLPDGNRPEPARSFRCSGSWSNPRRCTGRSRRRCAGR